MLQSLERSRWRILCTVLAIGPFEIWGDLSVAQSSPGETAQTQENEEDTGIKELQEELAEVLSAETIRADLEQFRQILKTEWLVASLSDADFDGAITELADRTTAPMSRADLLVELQKILALGKDGHATMCRLPGLLLSFREDQGFPDFIIDVCGNDYIAYRIENLPEGPVNSRYRYRYKLLREGFPYLTAIDGVPIEKWIDTISQFVPKGPELSVRWRCMESIHYLPFWRNQMGLPQSKTIKVELASSDESKRVQIDAPVGKYALAHYRIPKPDWKIVDDEFGYLWIRNPSSAGSEVILEAMPKFRNTDGLIVDLRGNHGGAAAEILQFMAAYLLPPENPRCVALSLVNWSGDKRSKMDFAFAFDDDRLSKKGREIVQNYEGKFSPKWSGPAHRAIQWRHVLLARPEAEPNIFPFNHPKFPTEQFYHYARPVVVLMDHRNFSAGELFLAGIRRLDNVMLVGSPTTSAGGSDTEVFQLEKSGLEFVLANSSLVQANGDFIDGNGIQPDVVVHPDVDYYLGRRDRMLETALEILNKEIASPQNDR